jgi:hypothetical protein
MWLLCLDFEFFAILAFAKETFLTQELFKTTIPSLKYNLFLTFACQYPNKFLLL